MEDNKLIVTRHAGLIQYLIEHGYVDKDTPHISFAEREDVMGKHVYGILPNRLSCYAEKLTEIQMRLPKDKRGKELSYEDIKNYIVRPETYVIRKENMQSTK